MSDIKKLTLSEIMARPMPEIDEEAQAELDALDILFPEKSPEPWYPAPETTLSREIAAWLEENS
ncbi:hypothetical protein I8748_32210 [Nostoc sp. CENA67]|uniref:Uncharacterized protein n=1 Tax=Amazonocrinis nigriterrae CENA67 TaxID=2794033 RepID=A0A8J7LAK3_9NOST|nr:hypothetical protein [Amazonocrinis nigriterrae]MBH8566764.1 hypothetical protein [Amazonocrinis nigriterrae CENA67]